MGRKKRIRNDINPFMRDFIESSSAEKVTVNKYVKFIRYADADNDSTNELKLSDTNKSDYLYGKKEWEKETAEYARLYRHQSNVVLKLSPGACQLFLYISYNIYEDYDYIDLSVDTYLKNNEQIKSAKTVYSYLNELIDSNIIRRRSNGSYWVNPYYLFKGDRLNYFKTNYPEVINYIEVNLNKKKGKKITEEEKLEKLNEWLMNHYNVGSIDQVISIIGLKQYQKVLDGKLLIRETKEK